MKEKITIIMTLLSLIGLAFHYNYKTNVIGIGSSNTNIKSNDASSIDDISIELEKEINNNSDNDILAMERCKKSIDETNEMSFNEAFNYYYSCLEEGDIFNWNNKDFALKVKVDNKINLTKTENKDDNQILVAR
tara:strand:+ start:378 stop:779 length:402 start_codon:yes stop_codon:yes gene_type:complete